MSTAFPGASMPAVAPRTGFFTNPWIIWLQQFAAQPGPIAPVVLGSSPANFTTASKGTLALSGGTITGITLKRGGSSATLGTTTTLIPMASNDVVTVSYSAAPAASFIPG